MADRMVEFIQTHISGKYKNKLIILDNTSSHRNPKVKEIINKETIYYMLFHINIFITKLENSIENYFSMLKSRLQKLDGLTHSALKENIKKVIREIPKEKYRNIIKGTYERPENMYPIKTRHEKTRRIIYEFSYHFVVNGVFTSYEMRKGVKLYKSICIGLINN